MKRAVPFLCCIALLAGCGDNTSPSQEDQDLATLRSLTQPYQSFDAGVTAGWDTPFQNACFSNGDQGAMGIHYGNGTIDLAATPEVTKPPFLMYEPQQNGTMKLVGVEYVKAAPQTDAAPVLYGQQFTFNTTLGVWTLHVWAWQDNPSGLYAPWNPTVTCQFAPASLAIKTHHH